MYRCAFVPSTNNDQTLLEILAIFEGDAADKSGITRCKAMVYTSRSVTDFFISVELFIRLRIVSNEFSIFGMYMPLMSVFLNAILNVLFDRSTESGCSTPAVIKQYTTYNVDCITTHCCCTSTLLQNNNNFYRRVKSIYQQPQQSFPSKTQ